MPLQRKCRTSKLNVSQSDTIVSPRSVVNRPAHTLLGSSIYAQCSKREQGAVQLESDEPQHIEERYH